MRHNTIQYDGHECDNTIQCDTIRYNIVRYDTIRYNAMEMNAIQFHVIIYYATQRNPQRYVQKKTIQRR